VSQIIVVITIQSDSQTVLMYGCAVQKDVFAYKFEKFLIYRARARAVYKEELVVRGQRKPFQTHTADTTSTRTPLV